MKNRFRITAGLLVAAVALSSGPVWAQDVAGEQLQSCGKWVLKLTDFGKLKIRDYNDYVPENFQQAPGRLKPTFSFFFGPLVFPLLGPDEFAMSFFYPDQQGMTVLRIVTGSYTQKGKKLEFQMDTAGVDELEAAFADLGENVLFGERELVTDIPFVSRRLKTTKFKGRIKKNNRLKAKLKTRLEYDIQFVDDSEFPDRFSAKGVFKLRSRSRDCSD